MLLKSICHMGGVQYMNKLLPLSCTRPMSFGVFTECVFIGDLSKRHVGTRKLLSKLQASLKDAGAETRGSQKLCKSEELQKQNSKGGRILLPRNPNLLLHGSCI